MDGPPAPQPPANGQQQRYKKSPHNNQQQKHQQWRKRSQHNYNKNKNRIPTQQKNFKRRSGETQLGFFGSVPSLQDLQRENRRRTRRHYGNNNNNNQRGAFPGALPVLSKPPPPPPPPYSPHYLSNDSIHDNNNSKVPWLSPTGRAFAPPAAPTPARFPGVELANPLATPIIGANEEGAADKLEAEGLHAGLDFFATNDGLVLYNDTPAPSNWSDDEHDGEMDSHSLSGSEDDDDDNDNDEDDEHRMHARLRRPAVSTLAGNGYYGGGGYGGGSSGSAHARIIQRLRERVAQQDAYIAELEDDTLIYKERVEILMHQLRVMQEGSGAPKDPAVAAADGVEKESNKEEPEPTAAPLTMKNENSNDGVVVNDGSQMNESRALKS